LQACKLTGGQVYIMACSYLFPVYVCLRRSFLSSPSVFEAHDIPDSMFSRPGSLTLALHPRRYRRAVFTRAILQHSGHKHPGSAARKRCIGACRSGWLSRHRSSGEVVGHGWDQRSSPISSPCGPNRSEAARRAPGVRHHSADDLAGRAVW